jgi:hypothetical protein
MFVELIVVEKSDVGTHSLEQYRISFGNAFGGLR